MNKVIVGSGSSDLGKVVSARDKLRIMQQEDCIKNNIYYSHPRYGGDGLFYLCIRSGASSPSKPTPDYFDMTPISMEDIYKKLGGEYIPIGSTLYYSGDVAPLGWLICDGSEFSASDYPELYAILNGKLPDLRGQFIRGLDRSKGLDPGRVLLSEQGDAIRNITGDIKTALSSDYTDSLEGPPGFINGFTKMGLYNEVRRIVKSDVIEGVPASQLSSRAYQVLFDASLQVPTADENRPVNVAMNVIIKAKHILTTNITTEDKTQLNNDIQKNKDLIYSTLGISAINFIQTPGEKKKGYSYFDNSVIPWKVWYCEKDNTDVAPSFKNYSAISNTDLHNNTTNLFIYGSNTMANARRTVPCILLGSITFSAGMSQVRFPAEPELTPLLDLGLYSLQTTLQSADGDSGPTCQAYFEKNNQTGTYEIVFQLYKAGVRWTTQLNCVISWMFIGDWMMQAFRQ